MAADPLLDRIVADCRLSISAGGAMPVTIIVRDAAEGARLALPPPASATPNWRTLLGFDPGLPGDKQLVLREHAYRAMSRDAAGDEAKQRDLNLAIEAARKAPARAGRAVAFAPRFRRCARAARWMSRTRAASMPLPNCWLGVSVEDQARADERREPLWQLAETGWRTFVSYEPALGPVDWRGWEFLSWLISGGESGPKARPSHPDWHRTARDFCAVADIAYLFKQWGAFAPEGLSREAWLWRPDGSCEPHPMPNGIAMHRKDGYSFVYRVGKRAAGRLLDGRTHDAWPS